MDETLEAASDASPEPRTNSGISRLARVIVSDTSEDDSGVLTTGERAALARLAPGAELRPNQIAALARAFVSAGLDPERWSPDTWQRWALNAHGISLTGHDGSQRLGEQLGRDVASGHPVVAESRVTKLLTSRGEAFRQLVPRLLRLLASQEVRPNWNDLGTLILTEGRDEQKAEALRLAIAGRYFAARKRASRETSEAEKKRNNQ